MKEWEGGVNPSYDKPYSFATIFRTLPIVEVEKHRDGLLYAEAESGIL